LSVRNEFVTNWRDSLPLPSTEWSFENESKQHNRGDLLGPPAWKENAELIAALKSLLKHKSPEIRGRVLPAAVGCEFPEADIREILSVVLLDPEPAVWFSAVGVLLNSDDSRFPHEMLVKTYRQLNESGKLNDDPMRRKYLLMLIYCDTSPNSPDAIAFLPDLIKDLAESESPQQTVYWLLIINRFGRTSLSNEFVGEEFEKAVNALTGDEKVKVRKILDEMKPILEKRFGIKLFEKKKPQTSEESP